MFNGLLFCATKKRRWIKAGAAKTPDVKAKPDDPPATARPNDKTKESKHA
jgi:hypothetical protein